MNLTKYWRELLKEADTMCHYKAPRGNQTLVPDPQKGWSRLRTSPAALTKQGVFLTKGLAIVLSNLQELRLHRKGSAIQKTTTTLRWSIYET